MSTQPIERLELQALEQRNQLHKVAADLRERIQDARQQLRLSKQAREHCVSFSILACFLGIAAGYGFSGLFTRD